VRSPRRHRKVARMDAGRRSVRWRVGLLWLLATIAVLGGARGVVALPERCQRPGTPAVDTAIADTVAWFERNQRPDGRWLYRYDAVEDRDLGDYNWVRHAGVLLSLEQAARFLDGPVAATAARVADAGWAAVDAEAVEIATPQGPGRLLATTGGSALAGVAWAERRERTGDPALDDGLSRWVRTIVHQVQADGSVLNRVDRTSGLGVPGSTGPFSTGQALFLLYRTARLVVAEGARVDGDLIAPARRIGRYIARDRARIEGFVPDTSDHWAAYGFADLMTTPTPAAVLTEDELAFTRKQIGLAGVQTRYESQRTNAGIDRWLRGRQTLPAGLGTVGESLAGWMAVAQTHPALQRYRADLEDRLACVADLLVRRQVDAQEAAQLPDPARVQGSWLQFGITQMDDQQHALSALLLARTQGAVDDGGPVTMLPRRSPVPEGAALVIVAAVALVNPVRVARAGRGCAVARPAVFATGVLVGLTAIGGPVVRFLDVSPATAVVAAGLVAVLGGAVGLVTAGRRVTAQSPDPVQVLLTAMLRPELLVASVAVGAGGQGWVWALAVSVNLALGAGLASRSPRDRMGRLAALVPWAVAVVAAVAMVAGVALVVEGIYAA